MKYFLVNKDERPIDIIHSGGTPKVKISKKRCVSFSDIHEAEKMLNYLQTHDRKANSLKVSTYAVGFMS